MNYYRLYIYIIILVYSLLFYFICNKLKNETIESHNLKAINNNNFKYNYVNKSGDSLSSKEYFKIIGKSDIALTDEEILILEEIDTEVLSGLTNIKSEMKCNNRIYKINKFTTSLLGRKHCIVASFEDITDKINELKQDRDKLKLILNSTAEAIYGLDNNGNCTFCNESSLKLLGYKHEDELIGKNMHLQIHHSYRDGRTMFTEECKIMKSISTGIRTHVDDEVFWTLEGDYFNVEYWSYPQFKDGNVVGAVINFMDITERKKVNEEIIYLSCHDSLTGIYNRSFFEAELKRLDTERNLPISILIGDANGLKLTNDIFGHSAGDELLIKVSKALKKICRSDDIIARIGGDEFAILLPKTGAKDAQMIVNRIREEISQEKIVVIKISISMGIGIKENINQDITKIIKEAETQMYHDKAINNKTNDLNQIKSIVEFLHIKYPREELHSKNVSILSQSIGKAMGLSNVKIRKLHDAGYLHDIGKIILADEIIRNGPRSEEEIRDYKRHSIVGYRILNYFNNTLDLEEIVLAHHEHWDGSGFPKGLKGKEIPLLARIIAVAESYDAKTNAKNMYIKSKEESIIDIKKQSGVKFDPNIVDVFLKILS